MTEMLAANHLWKVLGTMLWLTTTWPLACLPLVADEGGAAPTAEQTDQNEEVTAPPAAATILEELDAVTAALDQGDFPTVWEHCRAMLKAAQARAGETLSGREHFAVGLAHYNLVAAAFDKALKAGNLLSGEAQFAQSMRNHIMAPPVDLLVISHGQRVDLADYLAEGKTTIIDFYSEYCPPCRTIAPLLAKLAAERPDIRVVKVDMNRPGVQGIDWESPVARQFGLTSVPSFKLFGPDKQLIAEGQQATSLVQGLIGFEP